MDTTTAAYANCRGRISDLLGDAEPHTAERTVPACPQWTVRDVVAHLAGVVDDALHGNLAGAATDAWTDAQVAKRADRSLRQILEEWNETGPRLEAVLAEAGGAPAQMIFDVSTHEHDLRHELGAPGGRDADSTRIALDFIGQSWSASLVGRGFPSLRVNAGVETIEAGDAPEVTVATTPFEALRALSGRRSLDQIRRYDWDADPAPWLDSFTYGPFHPPVAELIE